MDKVVHFEIPFDDEARAKNFYGSIFDWKLEDWPMPGGGKYVGAHTTPIDETTRLPKELGAINGGLIQRSDHMRSPVLAISVSSIDEYLPKIEAAGGKAVMPKTEIAGMGWYAYVYDTEGNVIGLWEDIKK